MYPPGMSRWLVAVVIALAAVSGGCRRYHMGRVRMPDGHIETRRLQPEQSIAISRATVDLPCPEDAIYVERVPRTTQFMVHGCGSEAAYVCVRLNGGVFCDLEYVRPERTGGGDVA